MVVCQKLLNVVGVVKITPNGFGLGEEAELTAQKMKVAQMFNTPQQLHSSTTAAFLPNPCCMLPFSVHNGECLQWLKSLPDKCCDIFTDPPYNVGKDYGVWNDAMPDEEYAAWITDVLTECKRVANVLIVYVPKKWNLLYWNVLGAEFQEIILPFRPAGAIRYGYSNQFNKLLTNAKPKGKKPVLNVWDNMPQPGLGFFFREETYDHPGYTSEAITKRAIMQLCVSDVIADPFTGTGTTAVAALDAGKKFIGSEINAEYVAIAEKRVQRFINAPKLF